MSKTGTLDLFHGLRDRIEREPLAHQQLARQVASRNRVLDVGGRNASSRSAAWIRSLSGNPETEVVSTDIAGDYQPDLVDDISRSAIADASFSGIFCISILEHVHDYQAAVAHIHRILEPGGEVIIYVPFCYPFHDRTDHHRFTFTELAKLMEGYAEFRICVADGNGYGGVLTDVLTFHQLHHLPRAWAILSRLVNAMLTVPLALAFVLRRRQPRWQRVSWRDFRFYYTHLHLAHGFYAWGRKK